MFISTKKHNNAVNALTAQRDTAISALKAFEDRFSVLISLYHEALERLSMAKAENGCLSDQRERLSRDGRCAEASLNKCRTALDETRQALDESLNENDGLSEQVLALEEVVKIQNGRVSELESAVEDSLEEIDGLTALIGILAGELVGEAGGEKGSGCKCGRKTRGKEAKRG